MSPVRATCPANLLLLYLITQIYLAQSTDHKAPCYVWFIPFWVIPRRLSSNCRRFGTHYRFHLHRQVNEVSLLCSLHDKGHYKIEIKQLIKLFLSLYNINIVLFYSCFVSSNVKEKVLFDPSWMVSPLDHKWYIFEARTFRNIKCVYCRSNLCLFPVCR